MLMHLRLENKRSSWFIVGEWLKLPVHSEREGLWILKILQEAQTKTGSKKTEDQ